MATDPLLRWNILLLFASEDQELRADIFQGLISERTKLPIIKTGPLWIRLRQWKNIYCNAVMKCGRNSWTSARPSPVNKKKGEGKSLDLMLPSERPDQNNERLSSGRKAEGSRLKKAVMFRILPWLKPDGAEKTHTFHFSLHCESGGYDGSLILKAACNEFSKWNLQQNAKVDCSK